MSAGQTSNGAGDTTYSLDAIHDNSLASGDAGISGALHQSPQLVDVDGGAEVGVLRVVEVAHANLAEVARVAVPRKQQR